MQHVPICTQENVRSPTRDYIAKQDSMVYLGATLHNSGRDVSDLSRRIGATSAEFQKFAILWRSAHIAVDRKIRIFQSVIISKLCYACASSWLLKESLKKLDGFFCRCLRTILRIKPSFYSRVSNEAVLELSKCQKLSTKIRNSQLALLEQILTDTDKAVLRNVAFHGHTDVPETAFWIRRRGRPRQNWTEQLMEERRR